MWKGMCRPCGAGCCRPGYGVGHGSGGCIASGENGKSMRVSWCRLMEVFMTGWRDEARGAGHLSRKLCFQSSCGGLEACLKHGIELMQHGADGTSRASPSAFLEGRDS